MLGIIWTTDDFSFFERLKLSTSQIVQKEEEKNDCPI